MGEFDWIVDIKPNEYEIRLVNGFTAGDIFHLTTNKDGTPFILTVIETDVIKPKFSKTNRYVRYLLYMDADDFKNNKPLIDEVQSMEVNKLKDYIIGIPNG